MRTLAPAGSPPRREVGVFFRDVLRVYDICTTARATHAPSPGARVTIEVREACETLA